MCDVVLVAANALIKTLPACPSNSLGGAPTPVSYPATPSRTYLGIGQPPPPNARPGGARGARRQRRSLCFSLPDDAS